MEIKQDDQRNASQWHYNTNDMEEWNRRMEIKQDDQRHASQWHYNTNDMEERRSKEK